MVRRQVGTQQAPVLQRVAFLPKVRIERERSLDPVRAHEHERSGVHETQAPDASTQHLVEGPFVHRFVHPEHIEKRREGFSEDTHGSDADTVLEEGVGLHEHVGARDQRCPLRAKPPESLPRLFVGVIRTDDERE